MVHIVAKKKRRTETGIDKTAKVYRKALRGVRVARHLDTLSKVTRKLAPEVRIKQIGMREDLLSIIRHTSSDHFSEQL